MPDKDGDVSQESLLPGGASCKRGTHRQNIRHKWLIMLITCANILILLASVALFLSSGQNRRNSWLRETSYHSPLWGTELERQLKKEDKRIDGSIFQTSKSSRFRNGLGPSKEVDESWHQLELIRTFPITAEDVRELGKDPELTVKFPPEYGFGDDAYVAQLDIFHQLRCLNLLRRSAWEEYGRDGKTSKRPYSDLHWIHVAHCTEILEENLVCNANLDVVTFNWKETQDLPFPDFNSNKKCTNAEILVDWQEKHALPAEIALSFTRLAGAKGVPMEEEYFRLFGTERIDLHFGETHDHTSDDA